jgi:hypothetical protein
MSLENIKLEKFYDRSMEKFEVDFESRKGLLQVINGLKIGRFGRCLENAAK